jgi:hypothetical protein
MTIGLYCGWARDGRFIGCWRTSGAARPAMVLTEKIKDGKDGFRVHYQVPPRGSDEVPVPKKIILDTFLELTKDDRARAERVRREHDSNRPPPKTQSEKRFSWGEPRHL